MAICSVDKPESPHTPSPVEMLLENAEKTTNEETVPLMKGTNASGLSAVKSSSKRLPNETASLRNVTSHVSIRSEGSKGNQNLDEIAYLGRITPVVFRL